MSYAVIFYKTSSSKNPISDFIKNLSPSAHAKTLRMLDLLRLKGVDLGMPYSKALGQGLFELRIRDKQEVRLFYIFKAGKEITVLHAFQKKTQQTPHKELAIARKRQKALT